MEIFWKDVNFCLNCRPTSPLHGVYPCLWMWMFHWWNFNNIKWCLFTPISPNNALSTLFSNEWFEVTFKILVLDFRMDSPMIIQKCMPVKRQDARDAVKENSPAEKCWEPCCIPERITRNFCISTHRSKISTDTKERWGSWDENWNWLTLFLRHFMNKLNFKRLYIIWN